MLSLASVTDRAWLARALANLDDILVDHAHCEKKAASTALSLLFKYPERHAMLTPLARLAREELTHFEEVLGYLEARGIGFRHQVPSPYAGQLLAAVRPTQPATLLDTLLCAALIEARSCERMTLLADALADSIDAADLVAFYRGLLASEARHHRAYVDLACEVAPRTRVQERLAELACHEALVLARMPAMPRLHA
jgi:tRNA 2-(methylsulfanyl)-N6-isopentenyladenosine37 hydroxylase